MTEPEIRRPRVAIIGFGFSGLCLALQLKRSGRDDFVVLEKSDRLGGTWRDNTYPGAACDVRSFQYCFSFEQKTDWSRMWSGQEEILEYMDDCAKRGGVLPHVRFETEVTSARYDDRDRVWRIETRVGDREGEPLEVDVLVSGVGQLHKPVFPDIPGRERFAGPSFHSARWDHGVELGGKRIGVIGNGASAIQFVPEIAELAARLVVFQRTPNWIIPRGDRPYTEAEKARFARSRIWSKLYRWSCYLRQELLFGVMKGRPRASRETERIALENLHECIEDSELRRKLTPDYPIGAKRILIHDDYYPALARENVDLETSPVESIEAHGVRTSDGRLHELDVIVYATGFDTNTFISPIAIHGLDGISLEKVWKDGAEAYLGLSVSGFPNFFMMYGPNTNLGHNSIIFMIECQTGYILRMLAALEGDPRPLELRPEAMAAFNRKLHDELEHTAWAKVDHSWYKTDAGKITNNWSRTTIRYWWETLRPRLQHYRRR